MSKLFMFLNQVVEGQRTYRQGGDKDERVPGIDSLLIAHYFVIFDFLF